MTQPRWTRSDSEASLKEGWDIFERDEPNRDGEVFEIQTWTDDPEAIFMYDEEVWQFVLEMAKSGSTRHQQAIRFIAHHSPCELMRMIGHWINHTELPLVVGSEPISSKKVV